MLITNVIKSGPCVLSALNCILTSSEILRLKHFAFHITIKLISAQELTKTTHIYKYIFISIYIYILKMYKITLSCLTLFRFITGLILFDSTSSVLLQTFH